MRRELDLIQGTIIVQIHQIQIAINNQQGRIHHLEATITILDLRIQGQIPKRHLEIIRNHHEMQHLLEDHLHLEV